MAEKKKGLIKFITSNGAIISVLITLITAIITANYQFIENRRKSSDENFRSIVTLLSSENKEERIAAASNMGTFIEKDFYLLEGKYYDEAVDILINRLSIELDYNAVNAIIGSLQKVQKVKKKGYGEVIKKVLDINRNIFIQEYALKTWKEDSGKEYFPQRENFYRAVKEKTDKKILENMEEEMNIKREVYLNREMDFGELKMHRQVTADFISSFLGIIIKSIPIEKREKLELKLEFDKNSLNSVLMTELKLNNSTFKRSALSVSTILDTEFDGSTIIDTVFTFSDLTKSSFKDCKITASLFDQATLKGVNFSGSKSEFKDVFFAGSDLTGADFTGVKRLEPIYFYAVEDEYIKKAKFDDQFKIDLDEKLPKITEDDFKKYVENSELSKTRKKDLFLTIRELREKRR